MSFEEARHSGEGRFEHNSGDASHRLHEDLFPGPHHPFPSPFPDHNDRDRRDRDRDRDRRRDQDHDNCPPGTILIHDPFPECVRPGQRK